MHIKYARKLLFFYVAVIHTTTERADKDAGAAEERGTVKELMRNRNLLKNKGNRYQLCLVLFINNVDLKNNNINYRKLF